MSKLNIVVIKKRAVYLFRQVFIFIAVFLFMSVLLDYIRRPKLTHDLLKQNYQTISFQGKDTKTINLATASNNELILVYFWGSWCGVCTQVSPVVNKLHQQSYPVVSVALQSGTDADVHGYLQHKQYKFAAINDSEGKIAKDWQVKAVPSIFIIKNGKVIHSMMGYHPYFDFKLRLWVLNKIY